jgi:tetratricopeptide (TPR) repeat protein
VAAGFEPKSRNVIPRWRDFASTLELGELSSAASHRNFSPPKGDLQNLEIDWQREKTLSFAADLISAAVLTGGSEVAREAAQQVHSLGLAAIGEQLFALAETVLGKNSQDQSKAAVLQVYSQEELAKFIGSHRQRLSFSPRNAILWVDLSLLYAVQGLAEKARRAMVTAVGLEPNNRFVLRSAARLYIHRGEPDVAHRLLRRSEAIKTDPWIMSAEIATATSAKFVTFSIDSALKVLRSESNAPSDTTELSAAVATLELSSGSTNKAKKHLRSGLRAPNENSLAQVRWLQRDLKGFLPDLNVVDVKRSFEASVWEAHSKKDWKTAALYAVRWFKDQPFSSRPAVVGANIAAGLLEDYDSAIKLANQGLVSNPSDHLLYCLIAFSHASKGELNEARAALSQIKGSISITAEVTTLANNGLIAFREGQAEIGRLLYEAAYQKAISRNQEDLATGALTYWAREEILSKSSQALDILGRARKAVAGLNEKSIESRAILEIVEAKLIPTGDSPTKLIST